MILVINIIKKSNTFNNKFTEIFVIYYNIIYICINIFQLGTYIAKFFS
jgi:hypothetical protein